MARPSRFSKALADEICEQLALGFSLRTVCQEEKFPDARTVYRWLADEAHEEFRQQYAHARERQADSIVDEALDIADNASNDWMESNDPENPGFDFNGEHVQRSKLRVDLRKWYASKLAPKKYGDKMAVEHSGKVTLESLVLASMKPDEAE